EHVLHQHVVLEILIPGGVVRSVLPHLHADLIRKRGTASHVLRVALLLPGREREISPISKLPSNQQMRHLVRDDAAQASNVVVGCIAEHKILREAGRWLSSGSLE